MSIGGVHHALAPDIATQIPEFEPDPPATPRLGILHDPVPVEVTISEKKKNMGLDRPVRWRVREIVRERSSPATMIYASMYP